MLAEKCFEQAKRAWLEEVRLVVLGIVIARGEADAAAMRAALDHVGLIHVRFSFSIHRIYDCDE